MGENLGDFGFGNDFFKKHQKYGPWKIKLDKSDVIKIKNFWGFPGGTVVKNPPANAGDMGSSPALGRSHMPQSN